MRFGDPLSESNRDITWNGRMVEFDPKPSWSLHAFAEKEFMELFKARDHSGLMFANLITTARSPQRQASDRPRRGSGLALPALPRIARAADSGDECDLAGCALNLCLAPPLIRCFDFRHRFADAIVSFWRNE